jgi:hypothetical protein
MEYYHNGDGASVQLRWAVSTERVARIVEDASAGFSKGGSYWRESTLGYGGHLWWTYVNGSVADSWGDWRAELAGGGYEAFVWVPGYNATTQAARYTIFHMGGETVRTISQSSHANQWVSLGTYSFESGLLRRVRLTDATGETVNSRKIAFDAAKLVPR